MRRTDTDDLTAYLAALRTEVAKHGREKVEYKPEDNATIGFQSPDGWWVISVERIKAVCVQEAGHRRHKNRKATAAGRYARRESPEGVFVDWFSEKLQTAISDGEKLRANHGLS